MSKIAVVYWSGTGNTEIMAQESLPARPPACSWTLTRRISILPKSVPMMPSLSAARQWVRKCWKRRNSSRCGNEAKAASAAQKIALFGSYGCNSDGEWMRTWEEAQECRCDSGLRQRDTTRNRTTKEDRLLGTWDRRWHRII